MIQAILSFDVDAETPILVEGARYGDNAGVMSHQAYGPLVGVPRILTLLEEYKLPATFFIPGLTAERYPQTVEAILAAGHEVGHHSYAHFSPFDQDDASERADFERALGALERFGVKPEGFRCPSWEPTWRTPALVAEYGLAYDSSLMDADTPYILETDAGEIVELPVHWSLDDWEQYAYLPRPAFKSSIESPQKVLDLWISELDAMRRYGCLFVLTCHPFLSGRPHRVEVLRRLIEHALDTGEVEFAAGRDVAERARADTATPRRGLTPVSLDPVIYPS
ncbi:MAG TPA: polysaccharide deacetylase [Gaiellaceae bacterium]|jgi:peptidoglycan/xylan/chitin deacetylase (PgdA/CDA1 family)|nr:polysaccharide deacetylase [Gaiellaceae bacterium]HWJ45028.1 polysaccharide deacetylase [Gaiellaceae bacterium]